MVMKKFINDPANLTRELLAGYEIAYGNKIRIVAEKIVTRVTAKSPDKVRLVTLGGAGHEPALSGFVGMGMLDYSVVGDIFAAPGAPKVLEAMRLLKREAGILFVVLNHAGDVMSANLAAISPMIGRLPRSRSPHEPKTATILEEALDLLFETSSYSFSKESGVTA